MYHQGGVPMVMVGMKSDLRPQFVKEGKPVISHHEGEKMAKELGCYGYCECSSLKMIGMAESVNFALKVWLQLTEGTVDKKHKCNMQ